MRVVKIIPYYGSWPPYMHTYLESCRRNPGLEVALVTDLPAFPDSPASVRYFPLSLAALEARVRSTFGAHVPDLHPYKLCDFRPAFGVLFEDVVAGADFWGYGDVDMILGNLPLFLTAERLTSYEVLSFKKGHLQGPLTIYRNSPRVNNLFRTDGAYLQVFSDAAYRSFDEFGPTVFYTRLERPGDVAGLPSDNISVIAFKEALAGRLNVYCEQHGKEALSHRDVLEYRDGRVLDVRSGREYLFYHWVLEKRGIWFNYPHWLSERPPTLYMSTTGFYLPGQFRIYALLHLWRLAVGAARWATLKAANYVRRRFGCTITVDTYPRVGWVKRPSGSA